jgi:hypothetical protein
LAVAAIFVLVVAAICVVTHFTWFGMQRPTPKVRKAAAGLLGMITAERVDALLGRGVKHWREALELTLVAIGDDPRAQEVQAFLATRPTRNLEILVRRQTPAFPTGRSGADVRAVLDALAR